MLAKLMTLPIWIRLTASVAVAITLSLGGITVWSARQQDRLAIEQASQFAAGSTHLIMAGVAATMAAGDAGELKAFLDQFRQGRGIKSLKVLRGQAVAQQFGQAEGGAGQADPVEQRVLDQGQPHSGVEELAGALVYRAVVPMRASQNFMGKDCMKCHDTREGSVLGAVSLQIGLDEIRQASRDFQRRALLAAAIFSALAIGALYLFFTRTVGRPLAEVVTQIPRHRRGRGRPDEAAAGPEPGRGGRGRHGLQRVRGQAPRRDGGCAPGRRPRVGSGPPALGGLRAAVGGGAGAGVEPGGDGGVAGGDHGDGEAERG